MVRPPSFSVAMAAAAGALAFVIACSSFDSGAGPAPGGDSGPPACSNDLARDRSNCGQCDHACGVTEACENGACRPGCPDKTIHVSIEGGDDTRDGCEPGHPMKTIGAAIARAKAIQAKDHSIAVCRGTYPVKGLVLDYPVSLGGGYECTSFKRTKDFGYPKFDVATDTRIEDANAGVDRTTLTITGAAIVKSTRIDGFTVAGAATGDARSVAVAILDRASPTLRDMQITGGGTTVPADLPGAGSKGLVADNASPDIGNTSITGGTGTRTTHDVPSTAEADVVGMYVSGGAVSLHDSSVVGNTGARRRLVYGAQVAGADATGASAWHDVSFIAGQATGGGGGLFLQAATKLDLARATVVGPDIACAEAACNALGVVAANSDITLRSSRVDGGEVGGVTGAQGIFGAYLNSTSGVLENNVIVAGNTRRRAPPYVTGVCLLESSKGLRLAHNTVLVPEVAAGGDGKMAGIWLRGSTGADIENNLVVGESGALLAGIRLDRECGDLVPSTVANVRGNAFVDVARVVEVFGVGCATSEATTITAMAPLLAPFVSGSGSVASNVRLASTCAGDPPAACQVCAPAACPPMVVTPWTTGSPSSAELLTTSGYGIPPSAPCLVATGAVVLTPPVVVDLNGKPRPAKSSIGAFEPAGTCSP